VTADPIAAARALIEPLREHREQQTVAGGSWWEAPEICTQAADAIATLADALEVERAKVAAVYEAAATWLVGTGIAGDGDGDPLASCIRAIPPANAQAALDKLLIEARLEGWRFGRDEVVKWLIASGVAGDHDSDPLSSSIRSIPEPKENIHD